MKDAGPWITKANPEYTVLIDQDHLVTKLYGLVNVPTGVWINEQGKIVRPGEVAFIDDRFKSFSHLESAPYVNAIRDWVENGERSQFVMSDAEMKARVTPESPDRLLADAEFSLAEYIYRQGNPGSAFHISKKRNGSRRTIGITNGRRIFCLQIRNAITARRFAKEVQALGDKPYYPAPAIPG